MNEHGKKMMGSETEKKVREGGERRGRMVNGVFVFKQKTAYEIGTGDWSSDVVFRSPRSSGASQSIDMYIPDQS